MGITLRFLQIHLPKAESLLPVPSYAARGIGLNVNEDETEYICFYQEGYISTLNGGSLKLADKLTYLGSNVSFTKSEISTALAKAIDHMEVGPIRYNKTEFLPSGSCVNTTLQVHHMDADKT